MALGFSSPFLAASFAAALLLSGPYKVDISQRNATVRSFSEAFTAQTGVLFSYESTLSDVPLGNLSLSGKESLETLLSKAPVLFHAQITGKLSVCLYG